ncbi:TPA: hypothetical protein ACH3X2_003060 [Trebouxia sp. C0005]
MLLRNLCQAKSSVHLLDHQQISSASWIRCLSLWCSAFFYVRVWDISAHQQAYAAVSMHTCGRPSSRAQSYELDKRLCQPRSYDLNMFDLNICIKCYKFVSVSLCVVSMPACLVSDARLQNAQEQCFLCFV